MRPFLLGMAAGGIAAAVVMFSAVSAGVHPLPAAGTVFIVAGLVTIAAANARDY